jgi:hypothetical protein
MSVDGEPHPPLLTDLSRWRRAIFDSPARIVFERPNDTFQGYGASIDMNRKTLLLTKASDKGWKANFTFERPAHESQDELELDGQMDGHQLHLQLHLLDRNQFPLVSRGFHWISEYPFNR